MTTNDHARIALEVEGLASLTVNQLQEKWAEVWGEKCRSRSKDFLRKRIAWRIQANAFGGLSQRALDRARELADETLLKIRKPAPFDSPPAESRPARQRARARGSARGPLPGTVIARDYKGQKILVAVLENGFEFGGRHYRSLSAIAKEVTGAHWNGVRFFGLGGKKSA